MIYYFLQTGTQSFEGVQQNSVPSRKYAWLQTTLRYGRTRVTQTERLEICTYSRSEKKHFPARAEHIFTTLKNINQKYYSQW